VRASEVREKVVATSLRERNTTRGEKVARERARRRLHLEDRDLVALVECGEPGALAGLYDRHGGAAYLLAYRILGQRQAAEDLVQDAFLKVWRSAGSYEAARGSVRTWVLTIVHNQAIDQLRAAASRRRTQELVELSAVTYQPSDAFNEAWLGSRKEQVREALKTLPPTQLEVIELSYFSGYTHAEISALLGLSLGTVKSRLRLGLKKIKDHFVARGMAA
jgi:RNA polymerase sigma-70 factor, ECF subfamily